MVRRAVTISDDSVRSYLTRFEPGVLDDESGDANIVTMVLDNDGAYVRSSSRHAKVMQAVPGRMMLVNGDTLKAMTIATSGDAPSVATQGSVIAVNTLRRAEGDSGPAMLGGASADEISGLATKRYSAGEMGKGQIIVTFIYLK